MSRIREAGTGEPTDIADALCGNQRAIAYKSSLYINLTTIFSCEKNRQILYHTQSELAYGSPLRINYQSAAAMSCESFSVQVEHLLPEC
ncbi:hypothetical protein T10_10321 [Trichinella papuae]|uniref:Uncharacterized protein n=1 Tax=Trichinella papuae TaxID=268474 RepID=A0A0V1MHJ2_9BILA|nr:hypothetical protein T10_10321 [Trichinella papuae]